MRTVCSCDGSQRICIVVHLLRCPAYRAALIRHIGDVQLLPAIVELDDKRAALLRHLQRYSLIELIRLIGNIGILRLFCADRCPDSLADRRRTCGLLSQPKYIRSRSRLKVVLNSIVYRSIGCVLEIEYVLRFIGDQSENLILQQRIIAVDILGILDHARTRRASQLGIREIRPVPVDIAAVADGIVNFTDQRIDKHNLVRLALLDRDRLPIGVGTHVGNRNCLFRNCGANFDVLDGLGRIDRAPQSIEVTDNIRSGTQLPPRV